MLKGWAFVKLHPILEHTERGVFMIYTITFNPSLDYIMRISNLILDETNRCYEESIFAGGKGLNVSTILNNLGFENIALGFVAGFTGQEIEREIKVAGFQSEFIHLENGNSRINVKLKHGDETEINGIGPSIDEGALQALYAKLDMLKEEDWLIISGSIPQSLPSDIYEKILERLANRKIHFVVDATNDLLRRVLKYQPFLIKPNHRELEELFQVEIHNVEELIHYGKKLQEEGAKNVLISRAKDGALLIAEDGSVYECAAAKGKTVNSVGAGDSMVAGFLAGYMRGHCYEEALCMGTAAGGATAFQERLATGEDIQKVRTQVTCKKWI